MSLMDLVNAAGTGILHKHNVETRGANYMQDDVRLAAQRRQMELAAAAAEIQNRLGQGQLQEQETGQEAEALAAGTGGVAAYRARKAAEDRANALAKGEADLGETGARIDLMGSQANAADQKPEMDALRIALGHQDRVADRAVRAAGVGNARRNTDSLITDRETDNQRLTDEANRRAQGKDLPAAAFATMYQQARQNALLNTTHDVPTDQEVNTELKKILDAYAGARPQSTAPARPAPSMSPDAGAQQMFKYQGKMVPFSQLPPDGQAKARQRGYTGN